MKTLRSNNFGIFLVRMAMLYAAYGLCRVVFAAYNYDIVGPIGWSDIGSILKGSFIFDSASILYINIPFILVSLMPFHFRERKGYQQALKWIYLLLNGFGLLLNVADIFYFPFKLSRIASDDLHFMGEGNFGTLMGSFMKDYWWGVLLWLGLIFLLWLGFTKVSFRPERRHLLRPIPFFISQLLLLGLVGGYMVFAIRGFSASKASYPITMGDASLYVKPQYSSLVLSNPFCLIRTMGQKVSYPRYFEEEELPELYPVMHQPLDSVSVAIGGKPNVVFIILESFGSAHLKSFSDQFGKDEVSYTPFLDSLALESYVFTNAYQNGLRSIDAMPAIWASIPSFKIQFMSMPNSVAQYKAMPSCLAEMGYNTLFMHGAVRESMSFVAFGLMAGVQKFYSREDYEAEHGTGDFDGKWGIWDHKFIPFVERKLAQTPQPFCATLFTLSSHHPFQLPAGFEGKYPEGNLPIHKMLAYTDDALRKFFEKASKEPWFRNTLFVITADHGSGADNEKYLQMPYSYGVPIIFHYTGKRLESTLFSSGKLSGSNDHAAQHINLMPTLLRMVGYDEPFFSFGRDMFNSSDVPFAINYYGSAFNYMTDSTRYVFNEKEVVGVYRYREDPLSRNNITERSPSDESNITQMKAFIQQYYLHLKERNYTAE